MVSIQNTNSNKVLLGTDFDKNEVRHQHKYKRLYRLQQINSITNDYSFRQQLNNIMSPLTEFFPDQILEASIPYLEVAHEAGTLYGISDDETMLLYCLAALDLCLTARKLYLKREILEQIFERFNVKGESSIHDIRRAKLKLKKCLHDHRLRRKPVEEHYKVLNAAIRSLCLKYKVMESLEPALKISKQLQSCNYVSKHKEITALTCIVLTMDRVEKKVILTRLGDKKTKKVYNYSYRLKKRLGMEINTRACA